MESLHRNTIGLAAAVAAFTLVPASVACDEDVVGMAVRLEHGINQTNPDPFDDANFSQLNVDEGVIGPGQDLDLGALLSGDFGDGCELTVLVNGSFAGGAGLPFHGARFTHLDPNAPPIANVTIVNDTSGVFDASRLTFEESRIALDFGGLGLSSAITIAIEYESTACLEDGTPVTGELGSNTVNPDPFDDANFNASITAEGVVGPETDLQLVDPFLVFGEFDDGCSLRVGINAGFGTSPFDGLRFTLDGVDVRTIVNVTIVDTNIAGFDASRVMFEEHRIALNLAGLSPGGFVTVAIEYGEPSACPGDLDGSGDVGFNDLLAALSSWGDCSGCPADLDEDGSVGFTDVIAMLAAWGPCN